MMTLLNDWIVSWHEYGPFQFEISQLVWKVIAFTSTKADCSVPVGLRAQEHLIYWYRHTLWVHVLSGTGLKLISPSLRPVLQPTWCHTMLGENNPGFHSCSLLLQSIFQCTQRCDTSYKTCHAYFPTETDAP